uniref:Uncharacterized protein n=2 Tax=Meloidogyne enterolobii TaxID=390850 RepID=A0A6V7WA09_MELEN|nr:unnamed protein product [Meloidogyne enterolobii]
MTLTKKQQNKQIPFELILEILKSVDGYPNLIINKEVNDTLNQQKYFVWKVKENVLISSKIFYSFCGKALKKRLAEKIKENKKRKMWEKEIENEQEMISKEEEKKAKVDDEFRQKKAKLDKSIVNRRKKIQTMQFRIQALDRAGVDPCML